MGVCNYHKILLVFFSVVMNDVVSLTHFWYSFNEFISLPDCHVFYGTISTFGWYQRQSTH